MSAPHAAARRPVAVPAPPRRPPLRLVPPPARRRGRRLPFVAAVGGLLVAALLCLLGLNMLSAQDSFTLHDLRQRSAALAEQEQQLAQAVAHAQSPAVLAQRAKALGMVPSGPPAFLRLSDGRLLGAATAAPTPPPTASASPAPQVTKPTVGAAAGHPAPSAAP